MTDYKQLCADLIAAWDDLPWHYDWKGNLIGLADGCQLDDIAVERARAALAEPEPEGPTDEEIMELMPQQMRDDLAAAARALSGFDPDNIKAASAFRIILNRHCVDHARAVLARWGRPAPQPVPVSERLPEPGDCDAKGMCWWYCAPAERWLRCGIPKPDRSSHVHTHWLPAHALPLPS